TNLSLLLPPESMADHLSRVRQLRETYSRSNIPTIMRGAQSRDFTPPSVLNFDSMTQVLCPLLPIFASTMVYNPRFMRRRGQSCPSPVPFCWHCVADSCSSRE